MSKLDNQYMCKHAQVCEKILSSVHLQLKMFISFRDLICLRSPQNTLQLEIRDTNAATWERIILCELLQKE